MSTQSPHLWKKTDNSITTIVPSGKNLTFEDGGATIGEFSTDGTLAGDSDTAVPTEKAVKTYVDTNSTGLKWKQSVKCASTANLTFASGFAAGQVIDGYTLVLGNRMLIKDQSDQTVNGIYIITAAAPTRATDADTGAELVSAIVPVENGTVNANSAWVCTNTTITQWSSNIAFVLFGGMKAGNGLTLTADVASIDTSITADLATAQTFTNKTLTLPKIGENVQMTKTSTELNAAVVASHTQNTDTGTTAATFTVDSDATAGKIAITAVGGGTNNTLTIQNQALSGAVTITLPNATSQLATLALSETFTNKNINCNGAALGSGTGTPIFKYGDIDTAVSYLLTDSFVPVQVKVSAGGAVTGTLGAGYFSTLTGTALAAGGQLATLMVRTTVSHNLNDAYGVQTHMIIGANMATTNANAHLTPFSSKLVLTGSTTASKGWATAGLFIIDGAGAVTQMCYGVSIVAEVGAAACQGLLHLYSDETINAAIGFTETTHLINLFDFAATGGFLSADAGAVPSNSINKIAIDIGGVPGYIPIYADW